MEKYKPGQKLTYIPHKSEVEYVADTLLGGGSNADTAMVTVKMKNGFLLTFPYKVQDEFLTTAKPQPTFLQRVTAGKLKFF